MVLAPMLGDFWTHALCKDSLRIKAFQAST